MVRDRQPGRGDERTAAAGIETDARFLEMLEPLRRRLEIIFFLELLERRVVEKPHPFVGPCRRKSRDGYDESEKLPAKRPMSHRSCTLEKRRATASKFPNLALPLNPWED